MIICPERKKNGKAIIGLCREFTMALYFDPPGRDYRIALIHKFGTPPRLTWDKHENGFADCSS